MLIPGLALGHIDVRPRLVEQGRVTQLRVELPELRAGLAPERLEVVGEGLEVLSTARQGMLGAETVWSVRVRTDAPPGPVLLTLRAVFTDGESVAVNDTLTIVPPARTASFPWVAVVVGVLLAAGLAGFGLRLARRQS